MARPASWFFAGSKSARQRTAANLGRRTSLQFELPHPPGQTESLGLLNKATSVEFTADRQEATDSNTVDCRLAVQRQTPAVCNKTFSICGSHQLRLTDTPPSARSAIPVMKLDASDAR